MLPRPPPFGGTPSEINMHAITQEILDQIVAYETGDIGEEQILDFFQTLVDAGVIELLPWYYRKAAHSFLEAGLIGGPREA
jgi:hypothetical protein